MGRIANKLGYTLSEKGLVSCKRERGAIHKIGCANG